MGISRYRSYSYHPYACCMTAGCSWTIGMGGASRQLAKDHARLWSHHVQINTDTEDHWAPDDYDFETLDKNDIEIEQSGLREFRG